jgi:hypothetical protein
VVLTLMFTRDALSGSAEVETPPAAAQRLDGGSGTATHRFCPRHCNYHATRYPSGEGACQWFTKGRRSIAPRRSLGMEPPDAGMTVLQCQAGKHTTALPCRKIASGGTSSTLCAVSHSRRQSGTHKQPARNTHSQVERTVNISCERIDRMDKEANGRVNGVAGTLTAMWR